MLKYAANILSLVLDRRIMTSKSGYGAGWQLRFCVLMAPPP